MIIILSIILVFGAIFLFVPTGYFVSATEKALRLEHFDTMDIVAIVMFVSSRKEDENLEDLVAFKILTQMTNGKNVEAKRGWLIHGGTIDKEGSSYRNTIELITTFKGSGIKLKPAAMDDVFDVNESFQLINDIFSRQLYGTNPRQVVCDLTSGTKLMSLGMALACGGDRKLIYFPKTEKDDAAQYIHIDTQSLLVTPHA